MVSRGTVARLPQMAHIVLCFIRRGILARHGVRSLQGHGLHCGRLSALTQSVPLDALSWVAGLSQEARTLRLVLGFRWRFYPQICLVFSRKMGPRSGHLLSFHPDPSSIEVECEFLSVGERFSCRRAYRSVLQSWSIGLKQIMAVESVRGARSWQACGKRWAA